MFLVLFATPTQSQRRHMPADKVSSTIATTESKQRRPPAEHFGRIMRERGCSAISSDPGRFCPCLEKSAGRWRIGVPGAGHSASAVFQRRSYALRGPSLTPYSRINGDFCLSGWSSVGWPVSASTGRSGWSRRGGVPYTRGPTVRIRLPPPESPQTFSPSR
jgi:hypothetical protein